jgi:hypothetical protein
VLISRMITARITMRLVKRVLSFVLLACGIVLVCAGLGTTLGFTPAGVAVNVAAIAALLYAGGMWFGGASPQLAAPGADVVMVFNRLLQVVSGPANGTSLLAQFPAPIRPELEMRCRMALRGEHTQFSCEHAGARIYFDISPVQSVAGVVLYGIVIAGKGMPMPAVTIAPLTTVA